jgi:hypothetical protein
MGILELRIRQNQRYRICNRRFVKLNVRNKTRPELYEGTPLALSLSMGTSPR